MAVGIKDVARLAGVSAATVSRTLSGGTVSAALRAKVEDAVRKTGYRPNLVARRLRAHASDTIGLIIADIRNPFFTAVARAIDDIAQQSGRRVLLCNMDEDSQIEQAYLRLMEEEQVDGIILAATIDTLKSPERLPQKTPLVLIDRTLGTMAHDCVIIDNRLAAKTLVDHLVDKGCERIACIYGATSTTGFERKDGYENAMHAHHLKPLSIPASHGEKSSHDALSKLFAHQPLPDALIVTNGVLLLQASSFLMQNNIAVPQQIALTGFDDEPWTQLVFGGITVIAQPIAEIARHAMASLDARIENHDAAASRLVLESRLIARASTAR